MWADWGWWHMWSGWWWLFPLFMVGALIALCMLFMTGMFGGARRDDQTGSAVRLLNERFAKGEISREEYEERRTVLLGRA